MVDLISRSDVLSLIHFHRNANDEIEAYVKVSDIIELPGVTRFEYFTDAELKKMESAFCSEGLTDLYNEVRAVQREITPGNFLVDYWNRKANR